MKVDGNAPTFFVSGDGNGNAITESSIPIRLEIASRIVAGLNWSTTDMDKIVTDSLKLADALIEAYNKSMEG